MFWRRLKYWKVRAQREESLREEMELHIGERAAQLRDGGMTPDRALAEARRQFGNMGLKQEESREIWMTRLGSELVQDIRYGLRAMAANKVFSAMAILSLALGIGANTAIFSFMDSLLLRSLPVSNPETLAVLNWRAPSGNGRDSVVHGGSGSIWAAQIDRTMNQEIILARLCTAFAMVALLIACVGLYGTMAYTVARRTVEIGIRMALGAPRGAVVWMVLREVFALAAAGLAIGVPVALGASRFIESFLFGVKPNSPIEVVLAMAILLSAALLAGYAPARKASRIDPMIAVRHE